jgi:hypothetical protein
MSRKFLYRRSGSAVIFVIAILALFGLMAPPSAAAQDKPQLKRPQQSPEEKLPEEKKPKKKIKGPRAVGLLQLTASGKGTLIPIAILVDGKFYDASAYKADPVPMALDSGTVYEAEQAGDSLGLFTISGALHSKNPGSPHPWVGAGSFLPQGADAPSSPARPRLQRPPSRRAVRLQVRQLARPLARTRRSPQLRRPLTNPPTREPSSQRQRRRKRRRVKRRRAKHLKVKRRTTIIAPRCVAASPRSPRHKKTNLLQLTKHRRTKRRLAKLILREQPPPALNR